MKSMYPIVKSVYAAFLFMLGLTISFVQLSVIRQEREEVSLDGECVPYQKLMEAGIKCSMAFLAGGILSELRFVKFGHI